jgi:tRNA (mo5U34)-methyltransferase
VSPPVSPLTTEEIRRRVAELGDWFQNIDLNGVPTAPHHFLGDYPSEKWRRFQHAIPSDLRGRTVLDVGCNAGFYSIEMKLRGADRVVAIDNDPGYLAQAEFTAHVRNVEIELRCLDVYRIADLQEKFDLVLFMGVLYHLRYPLLALDLLHDHAVKDLLVFQTLLRGSRQVPAIAPDYSFDETEVFQQPGYPVLHFVENEYAQDPTNWWIPNRACAEAMLRSSGFQILAHPAEDVFLCRINSSSQPENRSWLKR